MTGAWYTWIHEEPFRSIFLASTMTLSLLSNGLLLYVIVTTKCASIGSYRYLLAVFSVCDIMTSFAHTSLHPIMHLTSTGLYFFPRKSIIIYGESWDTALSVIFVAIYYQTFLILAYHFVYRAKTVTRRVSPSFTDHWKPLQWSILGVVVNLFYIGGYMTLCALAFTPDAETRALAPPDILETYGVDLRNLDRGFLCSVQMARIERFHEITKLLQRPDPVSGVKKWHGPSLIALFMFVAMFAATASVILYCIWLITGVIRSPSSNLLARTRKMQTHLFHALLIQSAVPMLFSYTPLAVILVFPPFSGINLGAFGNVLFSCTAIFPAIDALFVLFFIRRFRTAVARLFGITRHPKNGSSTDRHHPLSR